MPHSTRALKIAFFLNLSFTLIESAGGLWTNSIAVLTDALHDLGDSLILGAAWYLQNISIRGRDNRYSYGYGRYSMLGGWLASGVLIVGSLVALGFTAQRFFEPVLPHTSGMIVIAIFGLLMNGLAAWMLDRGTSLNERGAYLHLLEDVVGWAAVLVGAIIMHFTGFAYLDPLIGVAISCYIIYSAIGALRQGTRILMQAQPREVALTDVRQQLQALPGVIDVHDQHSWSLDGNYMIHTVHLVVQETSLRDALDLKARARGLLTSIGIHHTTIELELPEEHCGLQHH